MLVKDKHDIWTNTLILTIFIEIIENTEQNDDRQVKNVNRSRQCVKYHTLSLKWTLNESVLKCRKLCFWRLVRVRRGSQEKAWKRLTLDS